MPRKHRMEDSGLIHHACMHGVNDEFIFMDDEDRAGYVTMLAATVARYGWLCLSYCLMGTHVHLLVETPEPNFGAGMQWLHGRYAACFNKQHNRDGHLFMKRYHDEPVLSEGHLLNAVGYIAVNPLEAGLCRDPHEWRWGSHHRAARGAIPRWLAHERLAERLDAISGSGDTYEALVAARTRAY